MNSLIDPSLTGKELVQHLVANKSKLVAQKKAITKEADGYAFNNVFYHPKKVEGATIKAEMPNSPALEKELRVMPVINTTFWHDSHDDVHIDGLWNKSLQETKFIMHVQEHKMAFDKIIADGDDVKAFTQTLSWRQLGLDIDGSTEALMFDSIVKADRNAFMHDQYRKGYVRNHSVGMRYVKIELAVNDEDYKEEFAVWNKYIDRIANKEHTMAKGYFWAVTEAKVVEGSAVPIGSNTMTPTYSVSPKQDTENQPPNGTENQPSEGAKATEEWKRTLEATKLIKL